MRINLPPTINAAYVMGRWEHGTGRAGKGTIEVRFGLHVLETLKLTDAEDAVCYEEYGNDHQDEVERIVVAWLKERLAPPQQETVTCSTCCALVPSDMEIYHSDWHQAMDQR